MIARCLDPLRSSVIGSVLVGGVLCVASALAGTSVTAEGAWIPWAPPALKVHVAYMTIVNRSMTDEHIVGADSPDYERIELHRSVIKDGVSTMQAVEKVTVPANGRVEFAPTGLHLMLVGPRRPQAVDGHVQIILRLNGGERVDVSAVVRRRDDASPGAHSHH
jgi:copper(I)-binding protein